MILEMGSTTGEDQLHQLHQLHQLVHHSSHHSTSRHHIRLWVPFRSGPSGSTGPNGTSWVSSDWVFRDSTLLLLLLLLVQLVQVLRCPNCPSNGSNWAGPIATVRTRWKITSFSISWINRQLTIRHQPPFESLWSYYYLCAGIRSFSFIEIK